MHTVAHTIFTCQWLHIRLHSLCCLEFPTALKGPHQPPPGGGGVHREPVFNSRPPLAGLGRVLLLYLITLMLRDIQPPLQTTDTHSIQLSGDAVNSEWDVCSRGNTTDSANKSDYDYKFIIDPKNLIIDCNPHYICWLKLPQFYSTHTNLSHYPQHTLL